MGDQKLLDLEEDIVDVGKLVGAGKPVLSGVYDGLEIRAGDFREVLADIPDNSVDVILTDPPYGRRWLPLWSDLGEFAARVLRSDGGVLLTYSGVYHLPEVMSRLGEHLRYWWTISVVHQGPSGLVMLGRGNVMCCWKPVLVYTRRDLDQFRWKFRDVLEGAGRQKRLHNWEQSTDEAEWLLRTFGREGGLVVDPFAGSGSFGVAAVRCGMRFIGAEILLTKEEAE
jgi:hypothetical protein